MLGFALLGWFWHDSLRAREQVLSACARACRNADVQLLDQTVALARLRLVREHGRLVPARDYAFEFTVDGSERWQGRVRLVGRRIDQLQMDTPTGVTILEQPRR